MRKYFYMVLSMCLAVLCLSGCSLFEKPTTKETIVIKYADTEDTIVFDTGNYLYKTKLLYTEGKVLVGIYDTTDDTGEKYFDWDGRFVKGSTWFSSYPHTLYAVYEDIDTDRIYSSYVKHNEDPDSIIYYVYGYRTVCSFYNFSSSGTDSKRQNNQLTANDKYFAALFQSNPKIKVKLTMRFMVKAKGETAGKQFRYQAKIGQESFDERIGTIPENWKEFSTAIEIVARQLTASQGDIYLLAVPKTSGGADQGMLVKNAYFELSLLQ